MNRWFSIAAVWVAHQCGKSYTFISACIFIILWGATGPYFDYSTDWQIFINTGTTIITFLMVFLLQNSQTRDSMAMQAKLDELIRATQEARNILIDVENTSDAEIREAKMDLAKLSKE